MALAREIERDVGAGSTRASEKPFELVAGSAAVNPRGVTSALFDGDTLLVMWERSLTLELQRFQLPSAIDSAPVATSPTLPVDAKLFQVPSAIAGAGPHRALALWSDLRTNPAELYASVIDSCP